MIKKQNIGQDETKIDHPLDDLQERVTVVEARFEDYGTYFKTTVGALRFLLGIVTLIVVLISFVSYWQFSDEKDRIETALSDLKNEGEILATKVDEKIERALGNAIILPSIELLNLQYQPLKNSNVNAVFQTHYATDLQKLKTHYPWEYNIDGTYKTIRIAYVIKNTSEVVLKEIQTVLYTNPPIINISAEKYDELGTDEKGYDYSLGFNAFKFNLPPMQSTKTNLNIRVPNDFKCPDEKKEFPVLMKIGYGGEKVAIAEFSFSINRTRDTKLPEYIQTSSMMQSTSSSDTNQTND